MVPTTLNCDAYLLAVICDACNALGDALVKSVW